MKIYLIWVYEGNFILCFNLLYVKTTYKLKLRARKKCKKSKNKPANYCKLTEAEKCWGDLLQNIAQFLQPKSRSKKCKKITCG